MKTQKFRTQVMDDEFSNEEIRQAIREVFEKYFDKTSEEEAEKGGYMSLSPKTGRIMSTIWYNLKDFKFGFKTENGDRFKTTTRLRLSFVYGHSYNGRYRMRIEDKSALTCLAVILNAMDNEETSHE